MYGFQRAAAVSGVWGANRALYAAWMRLHRARSPSSTPPVLPQVREHLEPAVVGGARAAQEVRRVRRIEERLAAGRVAAPDHRGVGGDRREIVGRELQPPLDAGGGGRSAALLEVVAVDEAVVGAHRHRVERAVGRRASRGHGRALGERADDRRLRARRGAQVHGGRREELVADRDRAAEGRVRGDRVVGDLLGRRRAAGGDDQREGEGEAGAAHAGGVCKRRTSALTRKLPPDRGSSAIAGVRAPRASPTRRAPGP